MKSCVATGCLRPPAFATRTRPAWCPEHIDEMFRDGGLYPLEPFFAPSSYRLCRCLVCGFEGHYRFAYVLQKAAEGFGERVCRACYWRAWAESQGGFRARSVVDAEHARSLAEQKGWRYLAPLTDPSREDDPHAVECNRCGKIEALRLGDIAWGCTCRANPAPRRQWTSTPSSAPNALSPELLSQWHPTRNRVSTDHVKLTSRRQIWWLDPHCGHEWQQTPYDRQLRERLRCPRCETILDSLAYHFPQLAAEWAPTNPLTAWQVSPAGKTWFSPEWRCPENPDHNWRMAAATRTTGAGNCPLCLPLGTSRIEQHYLFRARSLFGNAEGGLKTIVTGGQIWYVDIAVDRGTSAPLLIEYDGSFWHKDKYDVDTRKSTALLELGALLVRLREAPLGGLGIAHDHYLDMSVDGTPGHADEVLTHIAEWARQRVA